jgi:hypothetical protein
MTIVMGVVGQHESIGKLDEASENCTREGESPVVESGKIRAESRVVRDPRNPV